MAAITIDGLAGSTVSIEAITGTGELLLGTSVVVASLPVKIWVIGVNRLRFERVEPGQQLIGRFRMMAEQDQDVQEADHVEPVSGGIAGFTLAEVTGVLKIADFAGATHHLEADLRRI